MRTRVREKDKTRWKTGKLRAKKDDRDVGDNQEENEDLNDNGDKYDEDSTLDEDYCSFGSSSC